MKPSRSVRVDLKLVRRLLREWKKQDAQKKEKEKCVTRAISREF